jgi:hypothetical protein
MQATGDHRQPPILTPLPADSHPIRLPGLVKEKMSESAPNDGEVPRAMPTPPHDRVGAGLHPSAPYDPAPYDPPPGPRPGRARAGDADTLEGNAGQLALLGAFLVASLVVRGDAAEQATERNALSLRGRSGLRPISACKPVGAGALGARPSAAGFADPRQRALDRTLDLR